MRFGTALTVAAVCSLIGETDANHAVHHSKFKREYSNWAVQRTNETIERLERHYGKGGHLLMNPETGRVDSSRFGWDNRRLGGARLGSTISKTIFPGLTIDASGGMAFALGFAQG